jgi:hypothetical protein
MTVGASIEGTIKTGRKANRLFHRVLVPQDLQADRRQVPRLVEDAPFPAVLVLPLQNRLAYLAHLLGGDKAQGFEGLITPSFDVGGCAALDLFAVVLHQKSSGWSLGAFCIAASRQFLTAWLK